MHAAEVVRAHAAHRVGALQGHDGSAALVELLGGDVLAGHGFHELRFKIEVATVVTGFRRAHGHRPHPVAQGEGVMQHVGNDGPPAELGLVLVHRGIVFVLVDGVFAAPDFLRDFALLLDGQAAALEVNGGVNHIVAVEHHVVHSANLAEALMCMVHRPAAIVDQAARGGVEPFHVVPALAPNDRTMAQIAHFVIVLSDVAQNLHHNRRVIVLESVPVEHVVFVFGQHALKDALGNAVRDIAVELCVVAPQAQIVHGGADGLVPNNARLAEVLHAAGVFAKNANHIQVREVRHAGVARDFKAAMLGRAGNTHV